MENQMKQSGLGIASLILGIVGMLLSCVAIGIVPCIIGIILGIIGIIQKNRKHGTAIGGVVCSSVGIAIFLIVLLAFGNNEESHATSSESVVSQSAEVSTETSQNKTDNGTESADAGNVFNVGDVVETDSFKITFISAGQYQEENEYLQPKKGYEYWRFEFNFENISDVDQTVSSMMDWECYADNQKVDQTWIGDDSGLDATLSSGRTTQGTVFFEVPVDAESIELEYDINFWKSDKIVFIGK